MKMWQVIMGITMDQDVGKALRRFVEICQDDMKHLQAHQEHLRVFFLNGITEKSQTTARASVSIDDSEMDMMNNHLELDILPIPIVPTATVDGDIPMDYVQATYSTLPQTKGDATTSALAADATISASSASPPARGEAMPKAGTSSPWPHNLTGPPTGPTTTDDTMKEVEAVTSALPLAGVDAGPEIGILRAPPPQNLSVPHSDSAAVCDETLRDQDSDLTDLSDHEVIPTPEQPPKFSVRQIKPAQIFTAGTSLTHLQPQKKKRKLEHEAPPPLAHTPAWVKKEETFWKFATTFTTGAVSPLQYFPLLKDCLIGTFHLGSGCEDTCGGCWAQA